MDNSVDTATLESVAVELIEECDLAGTTYCWQGVVYFMEWVDSEAEVL